MFNLDALIISGSQAFIDPFTPTLNQTVFTLSHTSQNPSKAVANVNGLDVAEGAAGGSQFTISGTTFTWTSASYSLGPADLLVVVYT
jgi:hypothetical protein